MIGTRSHCLASIFVAFFIVASCDGLTIPFLDKKAAPPIQKVAIIGSGICGLSLAHALENSEACAKPFIDAKGALNEKSDEGSGKFGIEAHVFDSRESLNYKAGAGLQLTGGRLYLMLMHAHLVSV